MIEQILQFMTENKLIIIGAATTISEVIVIFWNMRRKAKTVKVMAATENATPESKLSVILWAANPINVFRKP